MIRINDDWVIDTDPWNFILKKDLHRKKTRDGEEKDAYRSVGYFRSVSEAFEHLGEEIIRERLNVPEIGLEQAVCILRECRDEIHALRKVIEEGLK